MAPVLSSLPICRVKFIRATNNQAVSAATVTATPTVRSLTVAGQHGYIDLVPVTSQIDPDNPTTAYLDLVVTDDPDVAETFGWTIAFDASDRPTRTVSIPQSGPSVTTITVGGQSMPSVWLDSLAVFTGTSGAAGSGYATTGYVNSAITALQSASDPFPVYAFDTDLAAVALRIAAAPVARPVIFDTDWMGDVDDPVAVRLLCHAERLGLVDVRAAILDTRAVKGPGSLDAFFTNEGHPNLPIGVIPNVTPSAASPSSYVAQFFDTLPHTEGYASTARSAVEVYRRALTAEADGSVDIISVGMLTALAQLLASPADGISPLTGTQLVTAKVRTLWVMGGQWPLGGEWNFTQDGPSASAVVAGWPASVPIVFSGYEVAVGVPVGGNLSHLTATDPLAKALADYGAASGRTAWDPMTTWLAALGDPTKAGYTTVQGTATVAADGGSSWTAAPGGPHRYTVKAQQNRWFQRDLNGRLLPGRDPAPQPVPGSSVVVPAPVLRTPSPASFSRAPRNTAADLFVQYHADDLADLGAGIPVPHLDDRRLTAPARQVASSACPTVAYVGGGRCLQFAAGQWLSSDMVNLPNTLTAYAMVRFATVPTSIQTPFAGMQVAGYGGRIFRLSVLAGGTVEGAGQWLYVERPDSPAAQVQANTWHAVAVVVTPTQVETFIDGVSNGATATNPQNSGRTAFSLGSRWWDLLDQQFIGYLREARMYSAAHSAATVASVTAEMAAFPTVAGPASVGSGAPVAWFKADAITGVASGAALPSWVDSTQYGIPLTPVAAAPTYVAGALNGRPVVRFNGTTNRLAGPMWGKAQPLTVFVVAKTAVAPSSTMSMVNANGSPSCGMFLTSGSTLGVYGGNLLTTSGSVTTTAAHVYEAVANGASSAVAVDGTATSGNAGSGGYGTGLRVGSSPDGSGEFFNGDIAEIVIYSGALTAADRSAVRSALGSKYGITVS